MIIVAIKKYHSIEFSWLIQVFTRRVWQPRVYHHNNSTTWGSQRNLHLVDQLAPAGETTLNTNQWKPAEERSDNCLGSRVIVLAHLLLVQAHCPHQGWVGQYFGSCYTSGPWCWDTHDRSCHGLWSEGGLTLRGGEAVRASSDTWPLEQEHISMHPMGNIFTATVWILSSHSVPYPQFLLS